MKKKPRISFVVAVQGNNQDNNYIKRKINYFRETLSQLCNRHSLDAELIIVNWNAQNSRISSTHPDRPSSPMLNVRIITVPPEVHNSFRNSDTMHFFEMIARNVGIRRARAPFILATSLNVVMPEELIAFLSKEHLKPDRIYSLYRHKTSSEIIQKPVCQEQAKNPFRWRYALNWLSIQPAIRRAKHVAKQQINKPFSRPRQYIHDDVCSDFILMAKDAWEKTRGYPELPVYPLYLDKALLYTAVSLGYKQLVLQESIRLSYIDQDSSVLDLPLKERLDMFIGMPWLDINLWGQLKHHYISGGEPILLNESDWGLAQHQLMETVLK